MVKGTVAILQLKHDVADLLTHLLVMKPGLPLFYLPLDSPLPLPKAGSVYLAS